MVAASIKQGLTWCWLLTVHFAEILLFKIFTSKCLATLSAKEKSKMTCEERHWKLCSPGLKPGVD